MSWTYLTLAILLEVCGTTSAKMAEGFTKPLYSVVMFVFYGLSLAALTMALKRIDVSVAYAIWSGLGTALIVIIGMAWFREPVTLARLFFVVMIITGVAGLHISGRES
ncbi:MAG: multidrug efflux SMR transporter [Nitrospinae bacterium]|nr:multidrug efflux SMR transporter [Nitrospinota bacterium]